jgi:hypothetical protein
MVVVCTSISAPCALSFLCAICPDHDFSFFCGCALDPWSCVYVYFTCFCSCCASSCACAYAYSYVSYLLLTLSPQKNEIENFPSAKFDHCLLSPSIYRARHRPWWSRG